MRHLIRWISGAVVLLVVSAPPSLGQALVVAEQAVYLPRRLSTPPLNYPEPAQRSGIEGTVIISAMIDTTGRVDTTSLQVVKSSDARLDQAAKEFVARSIYRPGSREGKVEPMFVQVAVSFNLNRRPW